MSSPAADATERSAKRPRDLKERTTRDSPGAAAEVACRYCGAAFASGNVLFKTHLLVDPACAAAAAADGMDLAAARARHGVSTRRGVVVAYERDGEAAAAAVLAAAAGVARGCPPTGVTRATAYASRALPLFAQETEVGAVGDVMTLTTAAAEGGGGESEADAAAWRAAVNARLPAGVWVLASCAAPAEAHAEMHASQRRYEAVVPLAMLYPEYDAAADADGEARLGLYKRLKRTLNAFAGRRAWHNFVAASHGCCGGDAAARRELARFYRVHDEALFEATGCVALAATGDAFLAGHASRLAAAAVAACRGWLPADCAEALGSPDVAVVPPLPPLPAGAVFLAEVRYARRSQLSLGALCKAAAADHAVAHARRAALAAAGAAAGAWAPFMRGLRTACAARIAPALRPPPPPPPLPAAFEKCPPVYAQVLELLRAAAASGEWPSTTRARAAVIQPAADAEAAPPLPEGSMSVARGDPAQTRASERFEALTEACFALEAALLPGRRPSSMIAINRNAKFKPHTDSGRGAGQTTSLIVGLGDYAGGDLFVEGQPKDIRYAPLEFDGWHERHWTAAFAGERFSLVWFTPHGKGEE